MLYPCFHPPTTHQVAETFTRQPALLLAVTVEEKINTKWGNEVINGHIRSEGPEGPRIT